MGLVNSTVILKNPRLPELDPVAVEALADSGALHLCIPEHVKIQLSSGGDRLQRSNAGRCEPEGG